MTSVPQVISKSPEVLSGTPVFAGTRVPIKNLMDYVRAGDSIETFLEDFPSVRREQIDAVLLFAETLLHGVVVAVSRSATHTFSKMHHDSIRLLAGLGVEGDAHMGETVKHRSRVAADPTQPNLRQVHLIHAELHAELQAAGFAILAGQMGENITTRGIDLLGLPTSTRLHIGEAAVVEVTGLRNPCDQLDQFQSGLRAAVLGRDAQGNLIRKAGVMGVVQTSGAVRPGDLIRIEWPPQPYRPLERV